MVELRTLREESQFLQHPFIQHSNTHICLFYIPDSVLTFYQTYFYFIYFLFYTASKHDLNEIQKTLDR